MSCRHLVGFFAALVLALFSGCSSGDDNDGDGGGGGGGSIEDEYCKRFHTSLCEQCWTCFSDTPQACEFGYSGSSAGGVGCATAAQTLCAEDDVSGTPGDDDCEPTRYPTDAEVQACMNQVENARCDQLTEYGEPGTFPACDQIAALWDCPDDESDMGDDMATGGPDIPTVEDIPTGSDPGTGTDVREEPVDVNTEGCEAALAQTCVILEECADDISAGVVVQGIVDACTPAVTEGADQATAVCETYLQEGVSAGSPTAMFLNEASASDVEDCMTGSNCNEAFLRDTGNAVIQAIGTGATGELASTLEALAADCVD